MSRSLIWSTTGLYVIGAILFGQQVSVPVLGYVWDSRAHHLRPILGTPAASSTGAPLETRRPLAAAVVATQVATQQDFALVLTGDTREAALLRPSSPKALRILEGVHAGAARIELSPEGSAAAFYFPDERLIQVVSGLPDRPYAQAGISLLPLRNPLANFTVSDDGEILLCVEAVGGPDSDPPAAVILSPAGDLNRIVLSSAVTAAAFLERTHDALLASGRELVLVRDVVAGVRLPLGTAAVAPTMLAFAPGGRRAILADARTGLLAVQNLEAPEETPAILECHCRPTGLSRLNGQAVWRLTDDSRSTLHLLDLAGRDARVLSVPPNIESH